MHCLKPFARGDAAKHAGAAHAREGSAGPEDANLGACVQAAERALAAMLATRKAATEDEDEDAESTGESDSDGGAPLSARGAPMAWLCVGVCARCIDACHLTIASYP